MTRMVRLYMIDQLLSSRSHVTFSELQDALEVSRATLKRDLAFMRDQLNAPIVYDRDLGAYRFDQVGMPGPRYQLPGLWLNGSEAYALLTASQLLVDMEPGELGEQAAALRSRLMAILSADGIDPEVVSKRIRLLHNQRRSASSAHFQQVARATLDGLRLRITHHNRNTGEHTEREISPQRLTHYRENWYVEAWCRTREAIRSFALDAIESVVVTTMPVQRVSEQELDAVLGSGFGIFNGMDVQWAVLRFTPSRAQWVSKQVWHPEQKTRWLDDGSYELEVPFTDARELVNEVMWHGSEVTVVIPESLRASIKLALLNTLSNYTGSER